MSIIPSPRILVTGATGRFGADPAPSGGDGVDLADIALPALSPIRIGRVVLAERLLSPAR